MALNIPAIAKRGADIAFKVTASLKKTGTLKLKPETGAYDVNTGELGPGTQGDVTIEGRFFYDRRGEGADQQYKSATWLLKQADVAAAGFTEKVSDTANAVIDAVTWDVEEVEADPGSALWILKLRRG